MVKSVERSNCTVKPKVRNIELPTFNVMIFDDMEAYLPEESTSRTWTLTAIDHVARYP